MAEDAAASPEDDRTLQQRWTGLSQVSSDTKWAIPDPGGQVWVDSDDDADRQRYLVILQAHLSLMQGDIKPSQEPGDP